MPDFDRTVGGGGSRLVVDAFAGCDADTEKAAGEAEKPFHDVPDREVGTQVLVIKVVAFPALLFCPVGHFPGFEGSGLAIGLFGLVGLQLGALVPKGLHDPVVEIFDESKRPGSVADHAALEVEVGKIGEAEQFGLLLAQLDDSPYQLRVVEFLAGSDRAAAFEDSFAEVAALGILQDGIEGGELHGETPAGRFFGPQALRCCIGPGGCPGTFGEPGEFPLVLYDELPLLDGIEDILTKFLGDLGQLALQFGHAGLLFRGEIRAGIPEFRARFLHKAFRHGIKVLRGL